MLKDYAEHKFKEFDASKKIRVLLELAQFIEKEQYQFDSKHFSKLTKYHSYLSDDENQFIKMANKEFIKVNSSQRQFQIYITLLERIVGNSSKEYQFMMNTGDGNKVSNSIPVALLLDGIRSTHNIGAILRSAECFGIEKVFIHRPYEDFDEKLFFKTAMGAQDNLDISYFEDSINIIDSYINKNYKVVVIDTLEKSSSYKNLNVDDPLLIVLGHEQLGVSLEVIKKAHYKIHIPLGGQKNSLNVSNTCAIILSEIYQKLK